MRTPVYSAPRFRLLSVEHREDYRSYQLPIPERSDDAFLSVQK